MKPTFVPALPIPEPLRGSDIPSFANYSIEVRLPEIARRTLIDNAFPEEVVTKFEALIQDIPHQPIRLLDIPLCPNAGDWEEYVSTYQGQDWLHVPWFFAEEYFYIRILEATGYFHPGPGQGVDPYARQKTLGLESSLGSIRALNQEVSRFLADPQEDRENFIHLLCLDLAGNQNDLSIWPVGHDQTQNAAPTGLSSDHLLVNHAGRLADWVFQQTLPLARADLVLDNAGSELVYDMCLADYLIRSGIASKVRLHLKPHPVFVSDAMPADVHQTITFLAKAGPEVVPLAKRLQEDLGSGRLELSSPFFWTSPLPMWEMPPELGQELSAASLVIFKGDANYRRLLGDRHWPFTTPWEQIVNYLPAPSLALRACKSEVITGLQPKQMEQAGEADPKWMIDGQWALIQFCA